jgi:hypothetical protein
LKAFKIKRLSMSQFLSGHALNASVENIILEAEQWLILVSPFIKLNHRYLDGLKALKKKPKCRVLICFGKSEGQYHKSFDSEALLFLKEMPNIKIVYDERLHAKFYANESRSLLSSMNLYDYSQNNNIEVGVESVKGSIRRSGLDAESWNYFNEVIDEAKVVFNREAQFKKAMLGLRDEFVGSETLVDEIPIPGSSESHRKPRSTREKRAEERKEENERIAPVQKTAKKEGKSKQKKSTKPGFCVRTGESIPFDVTRPLSDSAFGSWVQFGDREYPEKYCHYSGEPSFGETCVDRPVLRKNWRKSTQ